MEAVTYTEALCVAPLENNGVTKTQIYQLHGTKRGEQGEKTGEIGREEVGGQWGKVEAGYGRAGAGRGVKGIQIYGSRRDQRRHQQHCKNIVQM